MLLASPRKILSLYDTNLNCSRFYNCVGGVPYELPCATTLVFDEAQGTCVREEQASEFAKKCEKSLIKGNFD